MAIILQPPLQGDFPITAGMVYPSGGNHGAIDYGCSEGTPVYAAASGTVVVSTAKRDSSGNYISYGEYIKINHGEGFITIYAHLSKRIINSGDTVSAGQLIGYSGNTGNSTGPHLHFELQINGTQVDPRNYYGSNAEYGTDATSSNSNIDTVKITVNSWNGWGKVNVTKTKLYKTNEYLYSYFYGFKDMDFKLMGKVGEFLYGTFYFLCNATVNAFIPSKYITLSSSNNERQTFVVETITTEFLNEAISDKKITGTIIDTIRPLNTNETLIIPEGKGIYATREFSIEGYKNFNWGYAPRRVWQAWMDRSCPTVRGFAAIDGKILIACTSTFGNVGDRVIWKFSNGDILDSIIGDHKSQEYTSYDHNPADELGHNNGECILEFCGVPTGIIGYNNPYLFFGWTKLSQATNKGKYI